MANKMEQNMAYMFTTNKLKQHWMLDPRWTVADKVQQFKGIIQLYEREQKISKTDTRTTKQKNVKDVRALREDIKTKRGELNNSIGGDAQTLHNTLADYRPLQLAYQKQDPSTVVDNLKQLNYGKHKAYDKLIFKRKQQTEVIKELKFKLAECQDRADYQHPSEHRQQVLTGLIQDTTLKREVASTIHSNFKNILNTMKKDALYFDAILISLNKDAAQQGECLYRTTQLGQLATEYLDDRIQDYNLLEKAVKKSMKERQKTIKEIRAQVKDTTNSLKYLLSKDTDTELTKKMSPTKTEVDLSRNIESLESILKFVQNTTYVSQFDEIIPRMEDQRDQYDRLYKIVENYTTLRDTMIKKRNNAELMYDSLSASMAATTFQYMHEKSNHMKVSAEYHTRLENIGRDMCEVSEAFLMVRVSLQQLNDITQCVNTTNASLNEQKLRCQGDQEALPETPTNDVDDLLRILSERYLVLINNYIDLQEEDKILSVRVYQKVLTDASNKAHQDDFQEVAPETSLVSDIELDDPTIPSRAEIKKRSAMIVQDCAKKDDDQPIILLPLRGKTY